MSSRICLPGPGDYPIPQSNRPSGPGLAKRRNFRQARVAEPGIPSSAYRMKSPVSFLRRIALLEAVSFLILLGVAMPLKYLFHLPLAVKITGMIHGILFVVFCVALLRVLLEARWPLSRCALVFMASLIPLMPFFLDRRMQEWEGQEA